MSPEPGPAVSPFQPESQPPQRSPDGGSPPPVETTEEVTPTLAASDSGDESPADTVETPKARGEGDPIPAALSATRDESEQPARSRTRRAGGGLIAALVVGGMMIAVAVLILAREPIVTAVPGTAKIYGMVGLGGEELGAGLDIRDVSSAREPAGDSETLIIEGVIANTSNGPRDVPLVRVALFDADNEELQFVTVSPDQFALTPGGTIDFMARLENPAATARRIKVTFAPRDEKS